MGQQFSKKTIGYGWFIAVEKAVTLDHTLDHPGCGKLRRWD